MDSLVLANNTGKKKDICASHFGDKMDTMSAFAMGFANRGKPMMVFDWDKAALRIKESGCKSASAGLRDDWSCTGGSIFEDGKPVPEDDSYVFLASTWAVPELEIDGEVEPCYFVDDGRGWDSGTYWPESALKILDLKL